MYCFCGIVLVHGLQGLVLSVGLGGCLLAWVALARAKEAVQYCCTCSPCFGCQRCRLPAPYGRRGCALALLCDCACVSSCLSPCLMCCCLHTCVLAAGGHVVGTPLHVVSMCDDDALAALPLPYLLRPLFAAPALLLCMRCPHARCVVSFCGAISARRCRPGSAPLAHVPVRAIVFCIWTSRLRRHGAEQAARHCTCIGVYPGAVT